MRSADGGVIKYGGSSWLITFCWRVGALAHSGGRHTSRRGGDTRARKMILAYNSLLAGGGPARKGGRNTSRKRKKREAEDMHARKVVLIRYSLLAGGSVHRRRRSWRQNTWERRVAR